MAGRWWRAYDEALHDPKVQGLPPVLFKFWFNLLCAASKNGGSIPPLSELKTLLKARSDHVEAHLQDLLSRGLIDEIDGRLEPHNWQKRQYKSDHSTERVRKHRNGERNVSETPPDNRVQNTETEKKEKEPAKAGDDVSQETISTAPVESPKGQPRKYEFEGDVIKLNKTDFEKWTKNFPDLDLRPLLTARDAWLASPGAKDSDREKWFVSTPMWLANRSQAAKAQGKFVWPSGIEGVV